MALRIVDNGSGNHVEVDPGTLEAGDGTILLSGDANQVRIGPGVLLQTANITLGAGCSLSVEADSRLAAIEIVAVKDGHVSIGGDSNFTWYTRLYLHEPGAIAIGAHCLIASDVLMTISDMHSIVELETGKRINPAADIQVGDHVWLAHSVTLLGGSRVGSGAIVGLGSVVTGTLEEHTLSVGRPARCIRSGVTWDAALL